VTARLSISAKSIFTAETQRVQRNGGKDVKVGESFEKMEIFPKILGVGKFL
jgi:hypothetical protein